MAGAEFVDGWFVAQVLGEGAYGEVRLLQHASGARVALKALGGGDGAGGTDGAREAALHGALRHPNILRCLGHRVHAGAHYLFLEWAAGGELFERIEPDVGMAEGEARTRWRQLLSALRYLHARGVAHRDVKPENLLLAADGRLLLADFGLATVFRAAGRERRLTRVCGTPPYAAPEVLAAAQRPYRAPPADLWSAAVVLLAMLVGELPWARAAPDDAQFAAWAAGRADGAGLWRRVPPAALHLLRRALCPQPERRAELAELLEHPWSRQSPRAAAEEGVDETDAWSSQPDACGVDGARAAALWHSQPCAPAAAAAPGGAAPRAALWLRASPAASGAALRAAAAARGWRRAGDVLEAPGAALRVTLAAAAAGTLTLLQVRRARGCGLDYRRRVAELRADLAPLLQPPSPTLSA